MPSRKPKRPRSKSTSSRKTPKRPRKASRSRASAGKKRAAAARSRRAAPKRPAPTPKRRAPVAPSAPSVIGLLTQHVDYTSQDLEGVKRFYTEGLGFGEFEHDPSQNYLMIKTGASSSLGFMPPMPGPPEEWRPPREPALYLIVKDVDRAYRELSARNVTFDQPPQDMPWMHRVALLRDPEGRRVCLAQILRR